MKKRLIGGSILLLMIAFFTGLVWNQNPYMRSVVVQTAVVYSPEEYISWQTHDAYINKEYYKRPFDFNNYGRKGYYTFDPQAILTSLEDEDTNVFEPLLTNPGEVEQVSDASISWKQADYLRVFSAFSKLVWDDSIDSNIWKVFYVDFVGSCFDETCDLGNALIVYFKVSGDSYTTRIMEVQPSFGLARWGDGTSYPLVRQWEGVELNTARIAAEDALKIAEENGGREIRLKATSKYIVAVHAWGSKKEIWQVQYLFNNPPNYEFVIDFNSGTYDFSENYGLP